MKQIMIAKILLLVAVAFSSQAYANKAEIEYRKSIMEAIGGHTSAIFAGLKGTTDGAYASFHAQSVAQLALISDGIYPAGSTGGKSKASDKIWSDTKDFGEKQNRFKKAAAALAKVDVADKAAFAAAAKELGGSCKACHDDYKD